jgi:hypothetical protein
MNSLATMQNAGLTEHHTFHTGRQNFRASRYIAGYTCIDRAQLCCVQLDKNIVMNIFFNKTSCPFVEQISANNGAGTVTIGARGETSRRAEFGQRSSHDVSFGAHGQPEVARNIHSMWIMLTMAVYIRNLIGYSDYTDCKVARTCHSQMFF